MGGMKLRRKISSHVNSSPNSNGGNSSASRLSPISWFSKFMQMGGIQSSPKPTAVEKKEKKKKNSVPWPVPVPDSWDGGKFYCGEDDPYFRLSFGGGKSRSGGGGLKSVWYDPNERGKFSDMVSDVRRTRMSSSQNSKTIGFPEQKAKGRTNRRYFELNGEEVEEEEEEEMEPKRGNRDIEEDCRNLTALGRQTRRKPKQVGGKVRVYSPRTSISRTECKIKPLEDLKKKKRAKAKKKKKKKPMNDRKDKRAFNRFAVVKTSYDPHGDFRDSMMEMIEEQEIGKPEELEELLACYLTLNSDDYHDLIIKVFRQVWFELNLGSPAPPPPTYCC